MKKIILLVLCLNILFSMNLISNDFKSKIDISEVYEACGGENISPSLKWSDFPSNTKSFAIVMFDPDAPTPHGWYHWIVINIPKNINQFPKNAGNKNSRFFYIGKELRNDYGEYGYGGPCPPYGKAHKYIITVYALSVKKLYISSSKPFKVVKIIKKYAIDSTSIYGYYKRGWK